MSRRYYLIFYAIYFWAVTLMAFDDYVFLHTRIWLIGVTYIHFDKGLICFKVCGVGII